MDYDFILNTDALSGLKQLPDGCVQTIITSPAYYGLRDYGVEGQLGLEQTPEEYVQHLVEIFREARRVLRDDGTLWLNLGDSYNGSGKGWTGHNGIGNQEKRQGFRSNPTDVRGLKSKDLIGIPWSVAKALQQPFYRGRILNEIDRVWLAATIDSEGSICGFTHVRKDDRTTRTGIHITITNSSTAMLDHAFSIWSTSRQEHNTHGKGHFGSLDTYRWIPHGTANKADLLREIYPYLIVKKKQALLAWNFLELSKESKKIMHTKESGKVREQRAWLVDAISRLNHSEDVDIPAWCIEPPSLYEDGWYLRSDIIWDKPNPMPESVKDRPTRSHEYIFLFAKKPRYYYDAEAIKEPVKQSSLDRIRQATFDQQTGGDKDYGKTGQGIHSQRKTLENFKKQDEVGNRRYTGFNERYFGNPEHKNLEVPGRATHTMHENRANGLGEPKVLKRNKRSVWTISTKGYKGAHFATFPVALIEPMVLAGAPEGGVVLDMFMGSGTTAYVAKKLKRHYIGIELNPDYIPLIEERLLQVDRDRALPKKRKGKKVEIAPEQLPLFD